MLHVCAKGKSQEQILILFSIMYVSQMEWRAPDLVADSIPLGFVMKGWRELHW